MCIWALANRGADAEATDAALADDALAMQAYAEALDLAQLVPMPIKDQLVDKALAVCVF